MTAAERALEWVPKLNGEDQAHVLASLAIAEALEHIAEAIDNHADEMRGIGTQAHPIHVEGAA